MVTAATLLLGAVLTDSPPLAAAACASCCWSIGATGSTVSVTAGPFRRTQSACRTSYTVTRTVPH